MAKPFEQVVPNEKQHKALAIFRTAFAGVYADVINHVPDCRERSIALTKIEEAAMWASKAVTHGGVTHGD